MTDIQDLHSAFLKSSGACTDTRQLKDGGMFFALTGPNFNANAFAAQALSAGCAFAVVDDVSVATDSRYLLVEDVLAALQDLARHHRRQFDIPVIAITGTNGKTTTKELVHAVLSADRPTLSTSGNLNNHIGVPLTLLGLNPEHRIAVIEMGANKVGDILELVEIAEPTHGLITNIGKAHLEGFGSYEGVVQAKTEMYAFLGRTKGSLFVNADDALLMAKSEGIQRFTYGISPSAWLCTRQTSTGHFMSFVFEGQDGKEIPVDTHLIGDYNLPNAAAAVAIGKHFAMPDARIAQAIATYTPSNNRSQFTDTGRNQVIMDAYNANPTSMGAALRNFHAIRSDRTKLAILGDMLELGADSAREHQGILTLLDEMGMNAWLVGPEFGKVGAGRQHRHFSRAEDALEHARTHAVVGHLLLVKGSRGIKLETLLAGL
jgi:UDP-N-acetylmuramoyl-tripeptide--D-alanyl-D-alanine ligase